MAGIGGDVRGHEAAGGRREPRERAQQRRLARAVRPAQQHRAARHERRARRPTARCARHVGRRGRSRRSPCPGPSAPPGRGQGRGGAEPLPAIGGWGMTRRKPAAPEETRHDRPSRIRYREDPSQPDRGGRDLRLLLHRRGHGGGAGRLLQAAGRAQGRSREHAALRGWRPVGLGRRRARLRGVGHERRREPARDRLPPRPRADAGLHGRARGRGPRGDARRDRGARRRRAEDQPAQPRGPRDRSFGDDRRVRQPARVPAQRRPRVRAQHRALPVPQVGPVGLRQLPRRPARHRHLPSGQPRIPRADRLDRCRPARRPDRLSRHARGHRQPHHDGQRRGGPRLGRRRDRGGGRDAGPADLDADPRGGGLRADGADDRRHHRHRPRPQGRADCSASAAWWASSSSSTARGSTTCRSPTARRSPTWRPNTARPAVSSPSTARRCATCATPAARRTGSRWWRPTPRPTGCGAATTTRRSTPTRCISTWARSCPRSRGRSVRRTSSRSPARPAPSASTSAASAPARTPRPAPRSAGRARAAHPSPS